MSRALTAVDSWPVPTASAAVLTADGTLGTRGDTGHRFRLASVTKPLVTYAVLVGVEEGAVSLEDPAGPPGSTLRHLLAHTSGYGFDSQTEALARPGTRRIYSNRGIEEAAVHLERASGVPFASYLHEAVLIPLGMKDTTLEGSPAFGALSTVDDLTRFLAELLDPQLLHGSTVTDMGTVQFPGLDGVLPGHGRFSPLDWGLGVEMNFGRPGHWGGQLLGAGTFGHFGASGTFLWVDGATGLAAVALTDRDFEAWAREAWPALSDALVREHAAGGPSGPQGDAGGSTP